MPFADKLVAPVLKLLEPWCLLAVSQNVISFDGFPVDGFQFVEGLNWGWELREMRLRVTGPTLPKLT